MSSRDDRHHERNGNGKGSGQRTSPPEDSAALDAALLAEIENLHLRAQLAVQGALAGIHRSWRRGASIEFSEHKLYSPGDDIRRIDWRAFAKTDRYHVKQYEDETNLTLELLVDHSGSMRFASEDGPQKIEVARILAGALSYLALRQGDATGLYTFAGESIDELPARATSTHLLEILRRLTTLAPAGPTALARAIDRMAQSRQRRCLVFIISDLFEPDPELMPSLRRLAARRHDVTVLHLLDPAELTFPYENPSLFASMEDQRRLFVHPRTLRSAYLTELGHFLTETARSLAAARIDYHRIDTHLSPGKALTELLRSREASVALRRNDRT